MEKDKMESTGLRSLRNATNPNIYPSIPWPAPIAPSRLTKNCPCHFRVCPYRTGGQGGGTREMSGWSGMEFHWCDIRGEEREN